MIERVETVVCERRLRTPIRTGAGPVQVLSSVEVRLYGAGGCIGRGEAPLLHVSATVAAALARALRGAAEKWIGCTPLVARVELTAGSELEPIAAWALDVALARAVAGDGSLAAAFARAFAESEAPLRTIRTNALITENRPAAIEREAARLIAAGEHTLKLKVGAAPMAEDLDRVAAARSGAGGQAALRLDANAAWDEAEALRRLSAFRPFAPDYLEQPVAATEVAALARLRRTSPVPIAADEAARSEAGAARILETGAADVLVLKVPMFGTSETTRAVCERAHAAGVRVVFSSLYDGPVSLEATIALAAALRLDEAHGLATGSLLEQPSGAPFARRGRIEVAA